MPSEKSARVEARNRARNQIARNTAKTAVRAARRALAAGPPQEVGATVLRAMSTMDRAVKRGALHPNNVARRKSRLAQRLNAAPRQRATRTKKAKAATN